MRDKKTQLFFGMTQSKYSQTHWLSHFKMNKLVICIGTYFFIEARYMFKNRKKLFVNSRKVEVRNAQLEKYQNFPLKNEIFI